MPHGLARLQIRRQAIRLVQYGFNRECLRNKQEILVSQVKELRIGLLEQLPGRRFVHMVTYRFKIREKP